MRKIHNFPAIAGLIIAETAACGPDISKPISFVFKRDGFKIACREVLKENGNGSAFDARTYCPEEDPLKIVNIPPLSLADKEVLDIVKATVSCVYHVLIGVEITDKKPLSENPQIPVFFGGVARRKTNGGHIGGITILSDVNNPQIYITLTGINGTKDHSPETIAAAVAHEIAHAILNSQYHNPDLANPSLLSLKLPVTTEGAVVWRFTEDEAEKLVDAGSLWRETGDQRNRKKLIIADPATHCSNHIENLRRMRRGT